MNHSADNFAAVSGNGMNTMESFDRFMDMLKAQGYDSLEANPAPVDLKNRERRLSCILQIDLSQSVRNYLETIKNAIRRMLLIFLANPTAVERVELGIICFNSTINVLFPIQELYKYGDENGNLLPEVEEKIDALYTIGRTHTGPALMAAYNELTARTAALREAKLGAMIPLLICITDGIPCYRDEMKEEGEAMFREVTKFFEAARSGESSERMHVVTVAVGDNADSPIFKQISGPNTVSIADEDYDAIFECITQTVVRTSQTGTFDISDMLDR